MKGGVYGDGETTMLLDDLLCQGDEKNLLSCRKTHRGSHTCDNSESAGVRCEGKYMFPLSFLTANWCFRCEYFLWLQLSAKRTTSDYWLAIEKLSFSMEIH